MNTEIRKETMDGNTAAALASYAFTEVAAIYPITPSSPMAEAVDKWASEGKKNIFGSPVNLMEMQSEGGAAGTLHGSLQAGALSATYTSSQGLLLMIPNLYKIAGELLPGVLHVSARSLASNALSIFGDHQDVMSIRQTGVALLSSGNVQECMDLGCLAHLCALEGRLPFVHFFDGFRTSHEIQKIEVVEPAVLKELLNREALEEFRNRALNPDHPVLRGTTQNPDIFFQEREAINPFYQRLPEIVQNYMDRLGEKTGRHYKLFDYYGHEEADYVLIAMGSSCEVIKETIDYLNRQGEKAGLVQVRLYRPFSGEHLLEAIPKTVKRIAVLDRTKEPGADGEPLYKDICTAFAGSGRTAFIIGGRYGLASKDFTPGDVISIIKNLKSEEPLNGFTVGITDDVTGLSLPAERNIPDTEPRNTISCKFWGLGSDGTVGANKSAIKIIGNHTDQYVQAYFSYDSKKSGGLTVSHLRFGSSPIRSSYLVSHGDYIACHNQSYVEQYDLLEGIRNKGIFLLNCVWSHEELTGHLPDGMIRTIQEKEIRFFTINAFALARELGLGNRINMIMQSAFFALAGIIPMEEAVRYLKEEVVKNYGHQGQEVIEKNFAAIDAAPGCLKEVDVKTLRAEGKRPDPAMVRIETGSGELNHFVNHIMLPMNRQKGDCIPVSAFRGNEDGTFPLGTTQYEKRGIALYVPEWKPEQCIQCNQCALVCPHSALRPVLLSEEEKEKAPGDIGRKAKPAAGCKDKFFYMGISRPDCTGCGNCISVCPAKDKALEMAPFEKGTGNDVWEYLQKKTEKPKGERAFINGKESQFLPSYFEFSGACAGCGETPYARLVTQLFGDRMMISNSAGCTTVWGGSAPAVPYRKDEKGHGPAWGFSLFEDNAEYGLGMYLGYSAVRNEVRQQLLQLKERLEGNDRNEKEKRLYDAICLWDHKFAETSGTRERAENLITCLEENIHMEGIKEICSREDFLIKRSNWIFGGDGWAYDIGYGGLDHVLSTGADINIMVFDTEVYSNTGGQASKATPRAAIAKFSAAGKQRKKKELGMMAIQYGDVYVAQIAMGASPAHAVRIIQEAESYPGPSLIIGYAPCINHGIKGGMGQTQLQQKRAVDAGYWNLYHFDPRRKTQGENPFVLDSGRPEGDFEEFLMSEVRFASLKKKDPELAEQMYNQAGREARERYERYAELARKAEKNIGETAGKEG
ncbi:pyruvate:ferredoxin (flavodoxin) oxidoreductase [Eisenbergiella tayi]